MASASVTDPAPAAPAAEGLVCGRASCTDAQLAAELEMLTAPAAARCFKASLTHPAPRQVEVAVALGPEGRVRGADLVASDLDNALDVVALNKCLHEAIVGHAVLGPAAAGASAVISHGFDPARAARP